MLNSTERIPMQGRVKKFVLLLLGWGFIVLGIIGLFLPILQGVLFLIVGLIILSSEYVWARKLLLKIRSRFPEFTHRLDEAAKKAQQWAGNVFHPTSGPS
jgi:uncharacterized membrane protein YbaN (DUF454 family)